MRPPACPVGAIVLWPSRTPPPGWRFCEREMIPAVDYPALAKVLAAVYSARPDGMLELPLIGDVGNMKHIIKVR